MKTILVTGGAGYIGSHMCQLLSMNGFNVLIYDNLSTSIYPPNEYGLFIKGDIRNTANLSKTFDEHNIDTVLHFASLSIASESELMPHDYFSNNVAGTINLLNVMKSHQVKKIIFSSSAAIFGHPISEKINENHQKKPLNCYGKTKLIVEDILEYYFKAYGFSIISLRYFNASGSDLAGKIGENHEPETHLIPNVIKHGIAGKPLPIFGDDYNTHDGTCIRDYIHVLDICSAHLLSLNYLRLQTKSINEQFNIGNQKGFSVKEIINESNKILAKNNFYVKYEIKNRRMGDPDVLICDSEKIKERLSWECKYSDIHTIISTVLNHELNKRDGSV